MGSSPYNSPFGDDRPVREEIGPDAELLSPDSGRTPPELEPKPRPWWSYAPATYLLLGINCLVFLAMTVRGVSIWGPTTEQLKFWGGDNAGSVLVYGEWSRIVTAMFVHVGWIHLATNMWCLWNLGLLAEPLMGSAGVLAVYILTGAAGNLLSTLYNWWKWYPDWTTTHSLSSFPSGAGASGAVFGIAGALILLLGSHQLPVPKVELNKLRRSVMYFAGINLAIGIVISLNVVVAHTGVSIDNSAHLGGVLCGLLFAAPMVPRPGSPRDLFLIRRRLAAGMVVGILILFGFYLSTLAR
ncbi:MAG: rhomboid family intramembrane serine protease [Terracidiphilus sp.]|jgi:rhomboid protease GluP